MTTIGDIEGDTRSLDSSLYELDLRVQFSDVGDRLEVCFVVGCRAEV